MAYKITTKCISCDLCISQCPTKAIKIVDERRWIDPNLCTNCVGSIHNVAQCTASCPTFKGCIKEPQDYWESWFDTYNQFINKLTKQQDYWENWFDFYSQKFSEQLQSQQKQNLGTQTS
ncbi:MAG: 4Fe-4S binding protein [Cyanobacteria bacterium P01_A01_bin.84]